MYKPTKYLLACGLATALGGSAMLVTPAAAGALPANTQSIKSAAPKQVSDVRWRGRRHHRHGGHGGAIAAGVATGLFLGAAAAAASNDGYGGRYYDEPGVVYEPVPTGRCWIATDRDRGFGYWGRC
jgi:hypothetical protein